MLENEIYLTEKKCHLDSKPQKEWNLNFPQ